MEGSVDSRFAPGLEWLRRNGRNVELVNRLERLVGQVSARLRPAMIHLLVVLMELV